MKRTMDKYRKRILYLLITTVILIIMVKAMPADAYIGCIFTYSYGNQTLTYKVLSEPTDTQNGTAELIYTEANKENLAGEVIIPSTVMNQKMTYDVTQIEMNTFEEAAEITSIKLPDKISDIGDDAFRNCSKLTSINIPKGVTGIKDGTFYGCSSLRNMILPDNLTFIGNQAFSDCSSLTVITMPKRINSIGTSAFRGCSSLTSIDIPEGITIIENSLFQDCSSLESISLPEGITGIGRYAFYNCNSLNNIHLPDDIAEIGESAFYKCTSLTSIKIPYQVSKIQNSTFFKCSSLTMLRIQDKITEIGDFAFFGCSSLTGVNMPDGVTSIGNYVFYGCESLRPIRIPATVTSIGNGEFPYCGVTVYKNSYAEAFFKKNYPKYYQVIKLPLEEMVFTEDVMHIGIEDTVNLKLNFYPAYSSDITDSILWNSSNPSAVTVDANGTVKGVSAGEADITAYMGNYSATCHIIAGGEAVNPTSFQFIDNNMEMNKGESARLNLKFSPAESTNRKIIWKSSDDSVVSVENGRVYAKNPGTVSITASSEYFSAECRITVYNPLKEIYSDYDEIKLNRGETKRIAISYNPMDTTDNKSTVWFSDDETIASVENGMIRALKPGITNITAAVGTFTHTIPIVVQVPVNSISFPQPAITLKVGQTLVSPLTVQPSDTTDNIILTSSDESVAVCNNGIITALKRGKTTITAVSGNLSSSCLITVDTDIENIILNKTSLNLYFGKSEILTVKYNPEIVMDDKTITWSSSNNKVVTVDSKGKVQTVGTGTATITAVAGGNKKSTCSVQVRLMVPAAFKAVSGGYNSIKMTWSKVTGVSGYQIYRADTKTGTYVKIKETALNSYTNTGLISDKTYYYKIRGFRYEGTKKIYSSFSTIVSATPKLPVPANIKLVKMGSTMINFTWDKVNDATGYQIYRASTKSGTYSFVKSTISLHFMNYGLTKGRTYYYKVRAYKIIGSKKVYSNFSVALSIKI